MPSDRFISDEAWQQFEVTVRIADRHEFFGPDVRPYAVTGDADPDVFGAFDALDRIGGEWWVVSGVLVDTEFGPMIRRLTVEPWPPEDLREVTTTILRQVRVAELRDRAFVQLRMASATFTATYAERAEDETVTADFPEERIEEGAAKAPRRGRPALSDEHYRRIASAYLELFAEQAVSDGLVPKLAKQEGVLPETMRGWLHRARKKGYLTKGQRGKAGAAPGPRFYEQLPPGQGGSDNEKEEQ